jgi:uncharacterized membrane protein SirB2
MWIMMILSYIAVAFIDTKGFSNTNDKRIIALYVALMALSCAIGIANGYVPDMPSPAEPIRKAIESIIGG